jgi:A/G-specific adenine glycosylase
VISQEQGFFFEKRKTGDIWEGLFEFPLLETTEPAELEKLEHEIFGLSFFSHNNLHIMNISEPVKHILSHQKLFVSFIYIKPEKLLTKIPDTWIWKHAGNIHELPVPRVIDRYIHSQVFNKINENI